MKKVYLFLAGAMALTGVLPTLYNTEHSPAYEVPLKEVADQQLSQIEPVYQPFISLTGKNTDQELLAGDLEVTSSVVVENQQIPQGASAGDVLTYTIRIKNNAPDEAEGIRYSSTLDPNMTLVPGSLKITPVAVDDQYNTIGNVDLEIPASIGLLANDLSPDGTALTITGEPVIFTTSGATVTINQTTGAFTYRPAPGFSGEDTFTYTVQSTTGLPVTANVKITAKGVVWFINASTNVDATERNGTLKRPFKSVDGFQNRNDNQPNRPGTDDYIFIYSGNYTGSITLLSGQRLIGQGIDTVFHQLEGLIQPSGTPMIPATSGVNPILNSSNSNAIEIGQNNIIRGIDITSTSNINTKIRGNNFSSLKISEVNLGGSGPALNLQNGNISADFEEISAVTNGVSAMNLINISGRLNNLSGNVSATNASALVITGIPNNRLVLGITFQSVSSSNTERGIAISNTAGTFEVSGTGIVPGTGGTIQNITRRGVEFINVDGITLRNINFTNANTTQGTAAVPGNNINSNAAIYANKVTNLSLERVIISGTTADQGINLYETTGFKIENSSIGRAGTGINQEQGGIYAINTAGNVLLKKSSVSNASGRLVYFYNNKPAAVNITIDESEFLNALNGTAIMLEGAEAATMTLKMHNNSTIEDFMTSAVAVYANQNANMKLDIVESEIIGDRVSGQGIDLGAGGQSGRVLFNIKNNLIKAGGYAAINNFIFENGYLEGSYENNTIEIIGAFKNGLVIDNFGGGTIPGNRGVIKIAGNTLDFENGNGIRVNNGSSVTDRLDLTIENNIINAAAENQEFVIDAGNDISFENRGLVCLDVDQNTITQAGALSAGLMNIRTGGSAQSQILLTGSAQVLSAWNGNNNLPSGTTVGNTSVTDNGFGTISVTGSCQVPSNPALRVMSVSDLAGATSSDSLKANTPTVSANSDKTKNVPSSSGENRNGSGKSAGNARITQTTAGETITVEGSGNGFIIPAGEELEIKYSAVINLDIPANTCEVSNSGEISGTGFDPIQTNAVVTDVVSAPAFVLTTLPDITLNPVAGSCDFIQSSAFAISTTGCPAPELTFRVGGSDITFPYQFPAGNTIVEVSASSGVGVDAVTTFTVTGVPLETPVLSAQPSDQNICVGSNASFAVTTTASEVTYQWQKLSMAGYEDILLAENATANSATLVIENVQLTDHQSFYRCIVANPCASEISSVAQLNVAEISSGNLTGTTKIYKNEEAPLVTFTASGGTTPYNFAYTINDGLLQYVSTSESSNTVTISQPTNVTGEFVYTLVSISDNLGCTFVPTQTLSATITVEVDLPVNLVKFYASIVENTTLMTWETSLETNSKEFIIERSSDAVLWNGIGILSAAGESNKTNFYKWIDKYPVSGINYYRLKMVDQDGSFEHSPFRSIILERFSNDQPLLIYPNPAQDKLFLDVDIKSILSVEMLNVLGQRVLKVDKIGTSSLDIQHLSPGMYLLRIRYINGSTVTQKVIINR